MFARLELCVAVTLLMTAGVNAGADPFKPSVGLGTPTTGQVTPFSGYAAAESPIERSWGADAYNRAAINNPYNRSDFTPQQSFGLAASQMLGAAAACEQLHSDLVSMDGPRTKASKDASDEERSTLDAAQQHMLDPAATSGNQARSGEVDCDRVSGSFGQLQQIQIRDQDLARALGQPDAMPNTNTGGKNPASDMSTGVRSLQPR